MSNYYVRTIERAAAPRSRKLREAGTGTAVSGSSASMDTSGLVTLYTDQTITAPKTFANDVIFGGEVSEGVFGSMFVPSTEGPGKYALVFDSESAVDGEIPTETEGLDKDAMWEELSGSAGSTVIAKEHLPSDVVYDSDLAGYATQSDLDGRIDDLINGAPAAYDTLKEIADVLESNVDSIGDILTALGGKADKATTLAGYGITDAYTKTEIDEELAKYVTLGTPQTITGSKTFSGDVVLGGGGAKAFLPSTAGAGIYSIVFDAESAVDGEVPTESGIDMTAVWAALGTQGEQQIDASHLSGALASYVTQTALSSGLATKVDKVSGMGLSSNDFTDALLAKLNGIEAGANKYVLPAATATVLGGVRVGSTLAMASGILNLGAVGEAGTYTKVTVDDYGRVTGHQSLLASDIPMIPKSKISDFPQTWEWKNITGTPDTLAGYGINDGFNIVQVTGDGNAVSNASWQGHTLTLTRNTTFVDISSPQEITGSKTFSGDAVFGSGSGRLFLPSTAGAGIYSLVFDDGSAVDGETPSEGVGMDTDAMWEELGGSVSNKVIAIEHIPSIPTSKITGLDNALASYATRTWVQQTFLTSVPAATSSVLGGIKVGYTEISGDKYYAVRLNSSNHAYVYVPWVNTTYSLSSFGISATAEEINKLDGIGTLLHSGNYTSYTVTKTGGGASGTWPISISGNAATADVSNYLFLNPNSGAHVSQNDAVPANGRFAIYDVNTTTTAGGNDGYIMAFRWPSGNWVTQLFLDVDSTGIMALRHRSYDSVWTDWYRILHSGNIGSYALTPSNYTSYLDSRYVNVSGDTMTGTLTITTSADDILVFNDTASEKYFRIKAKANGTDWGGLVLDGRSSIPNLYLGVTTSDYKVWHSGNDGSGSGLDADLLDGYHANDLMILGRSVNMLSGSTYSGYIPPLVLAMMRGAEQVENPTFLNGSNLAVYNNASDGSVTHTRVTDTTAGNGSGYVLKIHSSASAAPGGGGFTFSTTKAYRQTTCVFRAKVPVGYTINFATNSVGGGGLTGQWLTERTGTGKWEWYACTVYFGSSPSSSHFYYLTPAANVDWYLAYAQVFYNSEALYVGMQAQKADRLTTSRTLWGQSFNGTGNVSGDMTGVGSITASGFLLNTNNVAFYDTSSKANRISMGWYSNIARIYAISDDGNTYRDLSLGQTQGNSGSLYFDASAACWGIGTTSPGYKLDVAGEIRATSGITIGSAGDFGWYRYNDRLVTCVGSTVGINVYSLLISNLWVDASKVPTNGIYCKGDIWTGGRLYIPSSQGNNVFDAYIA